MSGVRITLRGDKELRAALLRKAVLNRSAVNSAMEDALGPMRDLTETNARALRQPGNPKGGHLDQGVVSVAMPQLSSRTRFVWWVSFTKRARKIAHLVEFGTAPHDQPNRGVRHPGARPKPFFRPAFDTTRGTTLNRLAMNVERFIFGGK